MTDQPKTSGAMVLDTPDFEPIEPVAPWFYFVECDDPDYSGLFNHESEAQTQANDHGGSVVKLWNVPPTWKPATYSNSDFWQWLDSAYRDGSKNDEPRFTKYNMEVAYRAGASAEQTPAVDGEPEVIAEVVNKYGDPAAFAERDLLRRTDIDKLRIGTELIDRAHVAPLLADLEHAKRLLSVGCSIVRASEYRVCGGVAWLYGVDRFLDGEVKS